MTESQLERRTLRIKKKLKLMHAWRKGYLEEAVDNQLRLKLNRLTNDGDERQIKFLLLSGMSWQEIVKEAKRIKKTVHNHQTYLAKINSKSRKSKRKKD
jgi:hypothetical protein